MLCFSVKLGSKMDVGLGAEVDIEGERFVGLGVHTRSLELSFNQVSFTCDPFYNGTCII